MVTTKQEPFDAAVHWAQSQIMSPPSAAAVEAGNTRILWYQRPTFALYKADPAMPELSQRLQHSGFTENGLVRVLASTIVQDPQRQRILVCQAAPIGHAARYVPANCLTHFHQYR